MSSDTPTQVGLASGDRVTPRFQSQGFWNLVGSCDNAGSRYESSSGEVRTTYIGSQHSAP